MTPEKIGAITAFVVALVSVLVTIFNLKKSAQKDEVMLLREEVTRLHQQLENLEQERIADRASMEKTMQQNYLFQASIAELRIEVSMLRSENQMLRKKIEGA